MQAAAELIDAYGANGPEVSVRAICDRAQTSPATMYHYFDDIDEVVAAVVIEYMNGLVEAESVVFEATYASASEYLEALVSCYRTYFAARPGLRRLWFDRNASPLVTRIHEHYRQGLAGKLRSAMTRYTDSPGTDIDHRMVVAIAGSLLELAFSLDSRGDDDVIAGLQEACAGFWERRFHLKIDGGRQAGYDE